MALDLSPIFGGSVIVGLLTGRCSTGRSGDCDVDLDLDLDLDLFSSCGPGSCLSTGERERSDEERERDTGRATSSRLRV